MKILYLHGWHSAPGGIKPTYLKSHGHSVLSPTLHEDDFDAAVRTAKAQYDEHEPDVIVGSSRGGAVAMNIDSRDTPLVLLCPAWKNWGTAKAVKPNTVILHSKADETVPFEDSLELLANSDLPSEKLVVVGNDHRLADEESLKAMVEACDEVWVERIRKCVTCLRMAIDGAKLDHPDLAFIGHWPEGCCDAPYVFLLLYRLGHRGLIRKCANVTCFGNPFKRHEWIVADGITIDITADQFPNMTEKVIVVRSSLWHESLQTIEEGPYADDSEEALYERHSRNGFCRVYEHVLAEYAPPFDSL